MYTYTNVRGLHIFIDFGHDGLRSSGEIPPKFYERIRRRILSKVGASVCIH